MLETAQTASRRIESGEPLMLAGDERLLAALPRGNWIGGTIPYFLHDTGVTTREKVYVTRAPGYSDVARVCLYTAERLHRIVEDAPESGYTLLVLPAGSSTHHRFAREAPEYPGSYLKPVVGWVSGVHLDDLGKISAQVIDGTRGELLSDAAVALHVSLPASKLAVVRIVNPFRPGSGDIISFETEGFQAQDCLVNGSQVNLAEYLTEQRADTRWPLVADYMGTLVNVSLQQVDLARKRVMFYAPVFRGVEYRLAAPPEGSPDLGFGHTPEDGFVCSCILNFLYGELEGKALPGARGPVTFGEIAYQLLNQTTVFLEVVERR
ncbi:DUF6976 family protein [Myxococcota bacterium]